ncbi:DNA repair protein [Mesocricetibacter intestinalis]|uniref:DNA repair protein n=1 Tax=Mesocricetibacter intestinalis TaxID=1521930 RepID=UPI00105F8233|nr:DNA repair protein [Mesocricetibacter intestinalis]
MSILINKEFDWSKELEQTVVKSLATTFGLDFLLIEDKRGGDVDTIHNVRNNIWATEKSKENYDNRGKYNSHSYHSHQDYKKMGKDTKVEQKSDNLVDNYTGKKITSKNDREVDHVISAKKIHDDPGRVLSGLVGEDLANDKSNLNATIWEINNPKRHHSVEDFITKIAPEKIKNLERSIEENKSKLLNNPSMDRNKKEKLEKTINTHIKQKKELEELVKNPDKMKEVDEKAREIYNKKINWNYYTSSRFFSATAKNMHGKGMQMGTRQALGLILAEVWFELREQIPEIYNKNKLNFEFKSFIHDVSIALKNIWFRVQSRFKDLYKIFNDSYIGGALSSLTTTIINIFFTTEKMIVKMIRELWNSLVGIIKLIFFNPNRLAMGDLLREVMKLLAFSISTLVGVYINEKLEAVLSRFKDYGESIAAFISALVTGILNLGFVYFLEHSEITQKIWTFLNQFKSKYQLENPIDYIREVNVELDRYLVELTRIEFNMNPAELAEFNMALVSTNNELERNLILQSEIKRRNIELPYVPGNTESIRTFLKSKFDKV